MFVAFIHVERKNQQWIDQVLPRIEDNSLALPRAKTALYGIDTIRYIGKNLWQTLTIEIKKSKSPEIFKQKIKLIRNFDCSCRLYKNFVPCLGFL